MRKINGKVDDRKRLTKLKLLSDKACKKFDSLLIAEPPQEWIDYEVASGSMEPSQYVGYYAFKNFD